MTQDEIIEMARQAGMEVHSSKGQIRIGSAVFTGDDTTKQVEAFAKLVAAKEREACAKLCEAVGTDSMGFGCARLIRARGEV